MELTEIYYRSIFKYSNVYYLSSFLYLLYTLTYMFHIVSQYYSKTVDNSSDIESLFKTNLLHVLL